MAAGEAETEVVAETAVESRTLCVASSLQEVPTYPDRRNTLESSGQW